MRTFCIQQWRYISLLLAAVLWIVVFPVWTQWISTDPLNTTIALSPPGTVEENVHFVIPENYYLHFMFERDGIAFEQLNSSIGAMGVCTSSEQCPKGVSIPIRWSLRTIDTGATVSGGEVESLDSSGWSVAHVYRSVGVVKVQPGHYVFKAEILRPVPELAHMRTHLAMQIQPKATTTWQMGLAWWGAIAQYLLAWPVVVYASFLLVWRAGLTLRSTRTLRDEAAQHRSP